jgi:prevent-host-death family protein
MATHIEADEARSHLTEFLRRTTSQGERFVVELRGQPAAALVSIEDLQRLEGWDAGAQDSAAAGVAHFRRALQEAGVTVHWPSGEPVSPTERTPIQIAGPPLSEQIIADRR